MTYGELYKLFNERNRDIGRYINDYRPHGEDYEIQIWLENGTTFNVRWNKNIDAFEIKDFRFS